VSTRAEALVRMAREPEIYTHVTTQELFPDGYCECSCGPVHHKIRWDEHRDAVLSFCTYHKRLCGKVPGQKIRGFLEAAMVRSTDMGFPP
jgi:hypothetical protein